MLLVKMEELGVIRAAALSKVSNIRRTQREQALQIGCSTRRQIGRRCDRTIGIGGAVQIVERRRQLLIVDGRADSRWTARLVVG